LALTDEEGLTNSMGISAVWGGGKRRKGIAKIVGTSQHKKVEGGGGRKNSQPVVADPG